MFISLPTKQRVGEEEEEPAAERDREDTLKLECAYVTAAQTLTLYTLVYVNRNAWALQIAKKTKLLYSCNWYEFFTLPES